MICGDNVVAVQENLVAAYLVRPLPVAIGDDQNAAPRRHLVNVEFIRLDTGCIGHTS